MKVLRLAPVAAVALLVSVSLSGCSDVGDHAATVGDRVVRTSDVDFLTRMQCEGITAAAADPAQGGQVQAVPVATVRAQSANELVQAALAQQIAADEHVQYDRATYRQVMDQFEPVAQSAKAKDRDRFRSLVGRIYRGQLVVYQVAMSELAAQGLTQPNQQQVELQMAKVTEAFSKKVKISINPVYGPQHDAAGKVDPSLSRAVSSYAKDSQDPAPAASFVNALPKKLRCG